MTFHSLKPGRSDSPKQLLYPCSSFRSTALVSAGCLIAHFLLYWTPVQNLAQKLTFCFLQLASCLRPPPAVTHHFQQTARKRPIRTEKPDSAPKMERVDSLQSCTSHYGNAAAPGRKCANVLTGVSLRQGIRNLQSKLSGTDEQAEC